MRNIIFSLIGFCVSCNSLFYQGDRHEWYPPEKRNIQCARETITAADSTQLMTMYCPASVQKGIVLQFHGNAQNMNAHYQFLAWLIPEGYSLATFDYRGYGDSAGESDRDGIALDAAAYISHTRAKFSDQTRIYYGQSLGGAILMRALIDEGLRNDEVYIFEGTFASYQNEARTILARKWFLWPLQWLAYLLVTDNQSPKNELGIFENYSVQLIHGDADPVVAHTHGQNLAEKMHKELWTITGGKHLDTWHRDHGALRPEFLNKLATLSTRQPQ